MKLLDIVKTDNILISSPAESLSSALSHLSSTHDAVFVFDEQKHFLGLVNPYLCLMKTSYPGNAKLQTCLFHPPRIRISDSIPKVVQMMKESKLHYLPVFDDKNDFVGIISARRLLSVFANSPLLNVTALTVLKEKSKPLVTIYEDDSIAQAVACFKKEKVSKLVVMSKDMKLRGILSYYDLIAYLLAPKEKNSNGHKEGAKIHFKHMKVKSHSKSYILTISPEQTLNDALRLILDKKIGSVIVVDPERHPLGIITTRDILNYLRKVTTEKPIEFSAKNLSAQSQKVVQQFLNQVIVVMQKFPDIRKTKVRVQEEKGGGLFKVMLSYIPWKGKPEIYQEEGKNLAKVLQKIKK
jgi:CBS domain-containing protein